MFNPSMLFKFKAMKDAFVENHPKMPQFFKAVQNIGIREGMVIDFKVTTPEGKAITANMRVKQSDVEMLNELLSLTDQK